VNSSRRLPAAWCVSFVVAWCGAVVLMGPINYFGCGAENLELEKGSPRESYCDGFRDFLHSREPSEVTTPFPYLLPIVVLAVLGGYGVWRRSRRFLSRAAVVAALALLLHLILPFVLPG
jgi:hypothetical protein